ncbi:MAG: carboxypeptidase regulatory-like domain-containing protein, partial [bacterium]
RIAYEPQEIHLIAVPREDPARGEIIIRNTNQNGLGLHFTLIPSQEIAEVVRFDPPAQRVEPGGEINVGVIYAPNEVGVVEGEILVYHTGSNINSPLRISFTGIGTPGFGSITGIVTDLEEGAPVPEAVITLQPGDYITQTDDDGRYSFEQIPAFEYRLTCRHPDFLDYTTQVSVEPESLSRADIALRFATFELDRLRWEVFVDQNEEIDLHFSATNRGNGPVRFRSNLLFPGGDIDPWNVRWTLAVGDSTRDSRIVAAIFVNDRFFIAGGNSGNEINYIYVFGREGNFIHRFEQPARSQWGMRDLAWDGRLIWGGDGRILYGIDLEGNLIASINTPLNPVRAVAWDPVDSVFWICDLRSPIYGINLEGREIVRFNQPDTTRINGLAWWGEDPEGYPLYAFSSNENVGHPRQLYKINPQQRRFVPGVDLEAPEDARAGGIEFSEDWDPYNVVLIAILQMQRDGLAIYQVAPRTSWVTLEPMEGEIPPQESQEFTLTLNTMRMPEEAQFEVTISFNHTGRGHQVELPITLNVTAEGGITHRELALSVGWNLISLNIIPAESHMAQIFASLIEQGILMLIKDDRGNFTSARQGWQFPEWDPAKGYWVKLRDGARVSVLGRGIPFDQPIPLREGWQAISYYPRTPSDVRVALGNLGENLIVVKNGRGQFYLPAYDFSNMPPMREGEGYLVKTVGEGELVYRIGGRIMMSNFSEPSHFTLGSMPEISNMSLLILKVPPQIVEIGVQSVRGELIGAGVTDNQGRVGVAVWGGASGWAQEGEPLLIRAWDGQREFPLIIRYIEGEATWNAEGVSVAEAVSSLLPDDFALLEVFPNPFNSRAVITFSFTSPQSVYLKLYDLNGRVVKEVYQGYVAEGTRKITLDADDLPAGLYILQMAFKDEMRVRKVIIMK